MKALRWPITRTTSSVGTYSFKGLTPGKYTLHRRGYGIQEGSAGSSINIEVSTTATIDFTLTAGAATKPSK